MDELAQLLMAAKAWGPTGISGLIFWIARSSFGRMVKKIDDHETRISRVEGVCEERGRQRAEC